MTEQTSIRKNFIMNALLAVSTFLFPVLTFPYVSRVLGPEGNGRVSLASAVIAYFSMFAQLGVPTYGIRACAKVRDDREALSQVVQELLVINLVMDVLAYLALFATLQVVPRLREERTLYLIMSMTILLTSVGMEWLYKGMECYTYITVRSVLFKGIAVVAMFLLVRRERGYVTYGAISIFASSASGLCNLLHARSLVTLRRRRLDWRRHIKGVMVFFAMTCATTVYTNLDKVMLGFLTDNTQVGYYHAAVRIKDILVSLVTALGAVLLPRASYYLEHGEQDAFRSLTRRALHAAWLGALPCSLYFLLYAAKGIRLLSGAQYGGAVVPMQVLMPTLILIGITNILGMEVLVPSGRERVMLRSVVAGAVVDLALNALLIPHLLATGAAIGTLAAEAVVLAVQWASLPGDMRGWMRARLPDVLRPLAAVLVGTGLSLAADRLVPGLFGSLLASGASFFGGYTLTLLALKDPMLVGALEQIRAKVDRRRRSGDGT